MNVSNAQAPAVDRSAEYAEADARQAELYPGYTGRKASDKLREADEAQDGAHAKGAETRAALTAARTQMGTNQLV